MEIGLTGHLPLPSLPQEKPAPLHHLLERLRRTSEANPLARLRAALDCLEFLERYFAGFACGLVRKFDDCPELTALTDNAHSSAGLRRLFRFALHRLEAQVNEEPVRDLLGCFFLHGKRSLPFSHTRWLSLGGHGEPNGENPWSYDSHFESLASRGDLTAASEAARQALDVLQSWMEGALGFLESYQHFSRLDEHGWQCTVRKNDVFVEVVPPLPARLIPVEAQAPSVAPRTEDESALMPLDPLPRFWPSEEGLRAETITIDLDGSSDESPEATSSRVEEDESPPLTLDLQRPSLPEPPPPAPAPEPVGPSEVSLDNPRWSAAELKSFETSLRQIYPRLDPERVPRDYFPAITRFLSSVSSGYILVEGRQGTGKTTLCQAYRDYLLDSSLDAVPLLFSVKNQFYPDPTTFLEQLNEHLRIRPGSGQRAFEALDPQVIKNLNLRTPAEARQQRFASFLSELRLVNGARMVLILDGLDEGALPSATAPTDSLFSYLPATLPEGIYIIISLHPDRCRPGDREVLEGIRQGPSTEVVLAANSGLYRDFMERFLHRGDGPLPESTLETLVERSGGRLATAQHMLDSLRCQLFENESDLPPPDQIYERLFDRLYARVPDRYLDLFLLLATSDEPVSGDELSGLGISRTDVLELIHSLPSLFHCHQDRTLGLTLAHRAMRFHLQRTFLTSYAQSCLRLAQRALHRLSETEITILPVREDLDRLGEGVRRLLRWAYDSGDPAFLAEVCGHHLLGKLRRRIFATLEERALHHRKALILDTFARCLEKLVLVEGLEDFREELAWSVSSRALSYYHLGHYQRALVDIEIAISHFHTLVEEQGQEALRNGLAAALNRRSEIYRGLQDWQRAYPDAERAVRNYETVVQAGRSDLSSLLMLAYHNRAIVHRALRQYEQAEQDLSAALTGYLKLVDRENRRELRPQLAAVYQSRAALALDRGESELALNFASSALDLLETLVHQENFESLRNELASAYNDRGAILARAGILEEAERDYASAVSIRTYLVAEGRLDVRTDLAKTYTNRGLCLIARHDTDAARESFDRAVEILDRLVEEERREDLYSERGFALESRASLARQTNDPLAAREDLSAATGDYRLAVVSQGDRHLEDLARALNTLAEISLATGDDEVARRSCERALEIYEKRVPPHRRQGLTRERAIAHHNLAETLRHRSEEPAAEKEFRKAIELLTHEVEQAGRPQLMGELATSLLRYGQLRLQPPDAVLRLASRALAFFQGVENRDDERLAHLTDEAYLLRAQAYRKLGSLGAALDDVSQVINRLEESDWVQAATAAALVNALLERAALFSALEDGEAALLDLDRAWQVVEQSEQAEGPEAELRRCHIGLERLRLQCAKPDLDFAYALGLLEELEQRLAPIPLEQLASKDRRALGRRLRDAFQGLRLAALLPTRQGAVELTVERLSGLLELLEGARPRLSELLQSSVSGPNEIHPGVRLRTQRAWAFIRLGRLEDALRDFEATAALSPALETDPSPDTLEFIAEVESGRGAVLDSLERPQEALLAYGRAVEAFGRRPESALSPRRAACLTNRAHLLARLGRHQEALQDIDPALEIARSHGQTQELLSRWVFKAETQRLAGDTLASLETYRRALAAAMADGATPLDPDHELSLRLGLFRLSDQLAERQHNLLRVLALLRQQLASRAKAWRAEATRLLCELPYPTEDAQGLSLEQEIVETIAALLQVSAPGHSPLTETLLRRASKLCEMAQDARAFRRLGVAYYSLATRFCLLEYQKYGRSSLRRLVRCYLLTARALVEAEPPAQLLGLQPGLKAIASAIFENLPEAELEVEINNMARVWLSLPPSKLLPGGISRATLQKLRRW